MIIDLREYDRPSGTIDGEEKIQIDDPMAGEVTVPCRIELDYRQTSGTFHFHGTVKASYASQCHRCLDPVNVSVAGDFDLMVRRGEHGGETADDLVVLSPNQHHLDLSPLIRETVVLNEPMIVVCDESCRGLCPDCGANLNRETCNHGEATDPRWDALRR
ncbi:MAG TPA: DUF177 domain-containing protein [Candidatus Krumholzibacteria bacterium]|nr:DUF177 domain-containing protein [Candidatus Krumholzibacteria bacterium]